jgi:hypothetical protein
MNKRSFLAGVLCAGLGFVTAHPVSAAPGAFMAGSPNGAAIVPQSGAAINPGAARMAPSQPAFNGGNRTFIAPSAPVRSAVSGRQSLPTRVNTGGVAVSASRTPTAVPYVRSQVAGTAAQGMISRQTDVRPINRPAPVSGLPYGGQAAIRLSPADQARIAADRRNGQRTQSIPTSQRDRNRDRDRRPDHPRRPDVPQIYISSYYPSGFYNYPYGSGGYAYPYYSTPFPGSYVEYSTPGYTFDPGVVVVSNAPAVSPEPEAPSEGARTVEPPASSGNALPPEANSLVEHVQEELAQRGYYAGKVNGIVTRDFQDALRRFQSDQRLVPSGLINQASLFALGLN